MFSFDRWQKEAIAHKDGPCLVTAGPGSGKTAVIAQRVAELVRSGVPASNIAVLTFTRAAAGEMEKRYSRTGGKYGPYFGTFHSLCYMILRQEKDCGRDSLISSDERIRSAREAVGAVLYEDGLPADEDADMRARRLLQDISRKKSGLPPEFAGQTDDDAESVRMARMEAVYSAILKERGKIDFDDMVLDCLTLFLERPAVLDRWRQRFRYILIDEAQDMNSAQLETAWLLAGENGNIFEVGDDDQSVYGFRGVDPGHMLRFAEDHPGARILELPADYRSAPEIVEASGRLISHNQERAAKDIFAVRPYGEGKITLDIMEDEADEARAVAERIRSLASEGVSFGEIAVLCRTSPQFRPFLRAFGDRGIPCYCPEMRKKAEYGWIEEDLDVYLSLARSVRRGGPDGAAVDRKDLLYALRRPPKDLGAYGLLEDRVDLKKWAEGFRPGSVQRDRAMRFVRDLRILSGLDIDAGFLYLWNAMSYGRFMEECCLAADLPVPMMKKRAEKWKDEKKNGSGGKAAEERESADGEAVSLITMHASKGLEFKAVFVPTLNEGTMPHARAGNEKSVCEERRLMYVAATRARDRLFLSFVRKRHGHSPPPSRFLKEIFGNDLPEETAGLS